MGEKRLEVECVIQKKRPTDGRAGDIGIGREIFATNPILMFLAYLNQQQRRAALTNIHGGKWKPYVNVVTLWRLRMRNAAQLAPVYSYVICMLYICRMWNKYK